MIDLHIHTSYSDGTDSVIELLEKAEKNKLEYISITDHDNCRAYDELKHLEIEKFYNGKIISGVEIKCGYKGRLIEILGYNVDTEKINNWSNEFYKYKTKSDLQAKYFDLLYDKCLQMGLVMSEKENVEFDRSKDWASVQIYKEIKKHLENKEKVPEDFWNEFKVFSKKYCGDKNHILYINKTLDYPTLEEAIKAVKDAGGLVFLAHVFIYDWAKDKKVLLNDILENYDIDGIECFHSEFSEEDIKYLKNFCKEKQYYMSGGSDYHGSNKRNIDLAVGKGNLKIKNEIILDWI